MPRPKRGANTTATAEPKRRQQKPKRKTEKVQKRKSPRISDRLTKAEREKLKEMNERRAESMVNALLIRDWKRQVYLRLLPRRPHMRLSSRNPHITILPPHPILSSAASRKQNYTYLPLVPHMRLTPTPIYTPKKEEKPAK